MRLLVIALMLSGCAIDLRTPNRIMADADRACRSDDLEVELVCLGDYIAPIRGAPQARMYFVGQTNMLLQVYRDGGISEPEARESLDHIKRMALMSAYGGVPPSQSTMVCRETEGDIRCH